MNKWNICINLYKCILDNFTVNRYSGGELLIIYYLVFGSEVLSLFRLNKTKIKLMGVRHNFFSIFRSNGMWTMTRQNCGLKWESKILTYTIITANIFHIATWITIITWHSHYECIGQSNGKRYAENILSDRIIFLQKTKETTRK